MDIAQEPSDAHATEAPGIIMYGALLAPFLPLIDAGDLLHMEKKPDDHLADLAYLRAPQHTPDAVLLDCQQV
jgi:hypothetical protein